VITLTRLLLAVLVIVSVTVDAFAAAETRLLRRPTVSNREVAFAYAGDLWIVSREGGKARRLTATPAVETDPRFSPDGSQIAFTATVGGNTDVYVMPAAGGTIRRLTYHPGYDMARGWTPDGLRVILSSSRAAVPSPVVSSFVRLWTIGLDDGQAQLLPMPRAHTGSLSPDASRIAYEEIATEFETREAHLQSAQWRHYRGGRTHPIRVLKIADCSEIELPWRDSNDSDPMWVGDVIYFLSDRNFTANLFAYHESYGKVEQITRHDDFDIMSASSGSDAVVYEQAGFIHLLDARSGVSRRLRIQVQGDFPWAEPQSKPAGSLLRSVALSSGGSRAAVEARGEIFVGSGRNAQTRNITDSSGAHDRSPAWSPDDRQIAWLSDASGEYQLFVADPSRKGRPRALELPIKGYFSTPVWSPDGRHVALRDNHQALWTIEIASGRATRVDADAHDEPGQRIEPVWSMDSRWLAYSKNTANHLRAIFLYSIEQRTAHPVTDLTADAIAPAFDRDGRYLYFLASTDNAHSADWFSMVSFDRPVRRSVYSALLSAAGEPRVEIAGLSKRIVTLDVPAGEYTGLVTGPAGTIFYAEHEVAGVERILSPKTLSLHRHRVGTKESQPFLRGIDFYGVSGDGNNLVYRSVANQSWAIARTDRPAQAGDTNLDLQRLSVHYDPHAEWANMYREAWRQLRDDFYQPSMHAADWQAVYVRYAAFIPHINHRIDLAYVLAMVQGELSVGHASLTGLGDMPKDEPEVVGMLAADYVLDHGRYRIQRIYTGDPWSRVRPPLAAPGVNIREGEYLLEVNGKPPMPTAEIYAAFVGTANKPTQLRVSPTPNESDSRVVTVTPLATDEPLRTYEDWIAKNRALVHQRSGGRLGYVWLLNTGPHGYQAFNREFYAQLDKQGVIIDVRYNQGGLLGEYIIDTINRLPFGYVAARDGATALTPFGAMPGPKIMLINESAGSGGDAIAHYFKLAKTGLLIGTRTWGGLVGDSAAAPRETIDGGGVAVPNVGFYDRNGRWLLENEGEKPDIEVRNTAAAVIAGHDPQLDRAIGEAMQALQDIPRQDPPKPPPPDRTSRAGSATAASR
jgi:tricorn protease